jgi:hypothetical protein
MLAWLVCRRLRYGEQYVDKGMKYYEENIESTKSAAFRKKPTTSASWLFSPPPHKRSF